MAAHSPSHSHTHAPMGGCCQCVRQCVDVLLLFCWFLYLFIYFYIYLFVSFACTHSLLWHSGPLAWQWAWPSGAAETVSRLPCCATGVDSLCSRRARKVPVTLLSLTLHQNFMKCVAAIGALKKKIKKKVEKKRNKNSSSVQREVIKWSPLKVSLTWDEVHLRTLIPGVV